MRVSGFVFIFSCLGFFAKAQSIKPTYAITCVNTCVTLDFLKGAVTTAKWTGPNGFESKEMQPKVCEIGKYRVHYFRDGVWWQDSTVVENQQFIPTAKATGDYNLTCIFNCRNITGNDPGVGYGTTWYGPGGFVQNKTNVSICTPGRYIYKIFKGVCESHDTIIVKDAKINPTAEAGNDILLNCKLPIATMNATFPGSEYNYEWTTKDGKIYSTQLQPKTDKAGVYFFKIKRGTCEAKDSVIVTADFRKPTLTGEQLYKISCKENNAETKLKCDLQGTKFEWRNISKQLIFNNLNEKFTKSGDYSLRAYFEKSACESFLNILVDAKDSLNFSYKTIEACADEKNGELHLDKIVGGVPPYTISVNQTDFQATNSIKNLAAATYRFTVRDQNHCEQSSQVTIGDHRVFQWNLPEEFIFCSYQQPLELDASVKDKSAQNVQYLWHDGSTDAKHSFTQTGKGWVEAYTGCHSEKKYFDVKDQFDIIRSSPYYSPNVFNPLSVNALNRCFRPYLGFPVQSYELRIFDRWGNVVFKTNKQDECWDGTFKGRPINYGAFFWQIIAEIDGCGNPVPWNKSGGISIFTED